MGVIQRKEREKEEMRRRILDAAIHLFRERGYQATSLRNIAEAIEYSPATIYLYFKDKNAILFALQAEAAVSLRDHLLPAMSIEDPWRRLIESGRRYVDFGLKHSDLYDLMFLMRSPMEAIQEQECWLLGLATHQMFTEMVRDCQTAGHFQGRDPDAVTYTLWCHVHGMVALFVRDRMKMYPEDQRLELLKNSFAMLEEMAKNL